MLYNPYNVGYTCFNVPYTILNTTTLIAQKQDPTRTNQIRAVALGAKFQQSF